MKCLSCGTEMECKIEGHNLSWICHNCGDGLATSYFEPIELDQTEYCLHIAPVTSPSADVLRYFSQLLMCNYMQAKARLNDEIIIKEKATKVREIVRELITFNLDYTITPDYPYDIVEESK